MDDIKDRLRDAVAFGYMPAATRQVLDDAFGHIAELDLALANEAFAFASAVYPDMLEEELKAACEVAQIDIDSLEAQQFEAMFIAAIKARKRLIESGSHEAQQ